MPLLDVRNLSVSFATPAGTVEAVSGIDLAIGAGACMAIVGESGSGKSQALLGCLGLLAGLSIIAVFMLSETLSLREIVSLQAGPLWGICTFLPDWYVFKQPLAFGLFIITGRAEINRTPFDMPEAESELVSGFCTEYSSMKYALFFMAEYANMIVISAIAATLFLGGWGAPINIGFMNAIPGVVWLLAKVFALMSSSSGCGPPCRVSVTIS